MITIKQIRETRNYFEKYLSQNEYYSEGEKVVGRLRGELAEVLGIERGVLDVPGQDQNKFERRLWVKLDLIGNKLIVTEREQKSR